MTVVGCKIPLSMKGQFITLAAENRNNVNVQLALMIEQFIKKGGKANWIEDAERKELQEQITKLKKQVDETKKEAGKNASNLTANESKLNARIKALETEITSLKADKAKLSGEITTQTKSKASTETSLNAKITTLNAELTSQKREIEKLNQELKAQMEKYKTFHAQTLRFRNLVIEKHNRSAFGFGNEIVQAANDIQ